MNANQFIRVKGQSFKNLFKVNRNCMFVKTVSSFRGVVFCFGGLFVLLLVVIIIFFSYVNFHCCHSSELDLILANFLRAVKSFGIVETNTSKSTLSLRADVFTEVLRAFFMGLGMLF